MKNTEYYFVEKIFTKRRRERLLNFIIQTIHYVFSDSEVKISLYRVQSILLMISSGVILFVEYCKHRGEVVEIEIPDILLLSRDLSTLNSDFYMVSCIAAFLCVISFFTIMKSEDEKIKAIIYSFADVIKIIYCIYCLRFSMTVLDGYKNYDYSTSELIYYVAFFYLIVVKFFGYLYYSWIKVLNTNKPIYCKYADKDGKPLYVDNNASYRGRIYRVAKVYSGWKHDSEHHDGWILEGVDECKTIYLDEVVDVDFDKIVKIGTSMH